MAGDREEAAIRDRTGVGETETPFPCPDVRVERERACHAVVDALPVATPLCVTSSVVFLILYPVVARVRALM